MENTNVKYQIVDARTGQVVKEFSNKKRAWNKADKMDQEYGAVRYIVKTVILS